MNPLEYKRRRDQLMAAIGPDSIAIIFGAVEVRRNGDTHYPFRQESDFFYLTGFTEPNAVLVLTPHHPKGETTLFLNPRDPAIEQWTGRRLGPEAAPDALGIDTAYTTQTLDKEIFGLMAGRLSIHAVWDTNTGIDPRIQTWLSQGRKSRQQMPEELIDLSLSLHENRLIKSEEEQAIMQESANISAAAHINAMRACQPGKFEWELDAEIQSTYLRNGAHSPAYPSIIASGENACILHYIDNSAELRNGDLLLIDAGCEYKHYASDITRTFPISGQFSAEQLELYVLVLQAQYAAIATAKKGHQFADVHEASRKVLTEGLIDLGILESTLDEALEQRLDRKFLVHSCSHWLGLDVHDAGKSSRNGKSRNLLPGMVLTVEPGIYIPSNHSMKEVDPKWHGLGIRIEDDVLITEEGNRILSHQVPKEPDEIEAIMND